MLLLSFSVKNCTKCIYSGDTRGDWGLPSAGLRIESETKRNMSRGLLVNHLSDVLDRGQHTAQQLRCLN